MLIWAGVFLVFVLSMIWHNQFAASGERFPPGFVFILALWPLWVLLVVIAEIWAVCAALWERHQRNLAERRR